MLLDPGADAFKGVLPLERGQMKQNRFRRGDIKLLWMQASPARRSEQLSKR